MELRVLFSAMAAAKDLKIPKDAKMMAILQKLSKVRAFPI